MTDPTIGRYLLGMGALLITFGSLGFAAVVIRRRCLAGWDGAIARLAEAVIGFALLTLMLELLGAVGLFSLAPIVVAALLIGVAPARAGGGMPGAQAQAAREPGEQVCSPAATASAAPTAEPPVLRGAAAAATAAVVAEWAAITLQSYDFGIRTFDSVWYHLPWAAWFAQTGHVTPLRFTDVEYLTPFYPATAELVHGLGIVLFARDTASPGLNLVWLGLVLLAGYCIGRPRGVGSLTLMATALAMAVPAIDISQAGSAANDVVGVFFVLAAVALLLNAGGRPAAYVLAAVSAGLALAVKLSMVAPVLALTIGVIAVSPRGRRRVAAILWLVPLLLAGGFWYLRNLIAVGNPLPWLNLPGLATPIPALQQHTGFSVAHYLTSGHAWSAYFQPGLASGLGPWWYAIVAMAIAGPILCLLRRDSRDSRDGRARTAADGVMVRMLGLVALASLLAYLVTPESAAGPDGQPLGFAFNLRYAAPVLALSLPLLPLAPVLDGTRRRAVLAAALIAALAATLAQARLWPSRQAGGAIGVALVVLLAAALTALLARHPPRALRSPPSPPSPDSPDSPDSPESPESPHPPAPADPPGPPHPPRRPLTAPVAAAGVAVLVIAAVAAGYPWQRHYLHGRYAFHPGVSYFARVWSFFRQVRHARVGVVGTFGGFLSYPLFGINDSNHVEYVGRRGPHGSFTAIGSCPQWRATVNAGHFRYLVTTPARDPWHPKPLRPSPEGRWTATDPAAQLIYTRRATGQPISIYVLHGPLHPSSCP